MRTQHRLLSSIATWALPLAIGLLALATRTINLENWPRWYVDEGRQGETAFYLLRGVWGIEPIAPNFFPPLAPPLAALSMLAWGQTYFAIRLPSALAGAISCLLVYAIGRRWYGARVGAVAGLLMALSYAAVYMDRMAMKDAVMGMLMLAAVACLVEARGGSRRWAIAAGILGGLAFLAKYPGAIFIAFATLELLRRRQLSQLGYVLGGFSSLALIYPAMGLVLGWENFVTDMVGQAGLFGYDQAFGDTLRVLTMSDPTDQLHWNNRFRLNLWTTLGFVLLFYLAARRREKDSTLLLWGLSGITALVFAAPTFWMHLLPLIPVYYLAMAIAFDDLLDQWRERGIHFWALGLLLLLMALSEFALRRVAPIDLANYVRYFFLAGAALMGLDLAAQGLLAARPGLTALASRACRGTALALLVAVALAAGVSIFPTIAKEESGDQQATVRFLKSELYKSEFYSPDLAAAAAPIAYPLGDQGFEYAFTAYVTFEGPMPLVYEQQLGRLNRDMSLSVFRFVVVDTPLLALPGNYAGPALAMKAEREWLLQFSSGDYKVYENPVRPGKEISFLDDYIAYMVKTRFDLTDRLVLSDDADEKKSGQNSLRIDLGLSQNNTLYLFQTPEPQDWSTYREISFWWYGDNVGVVAVDIPSPDWLNYYHLSFTDNWEGWRRFRLPLGMAKPMGNPSWQTVWALALKFQGLPAAGTVRIDDIRFYQPD